MGTGEEARAREAGWSVLRAQPEHLAALPAIERAAAGLFAQGELPDAVRSETTSLRTLRAAARAGRLWVALDASGAPIGFAPVELVDGVPHLDEIDVHPTHGRRGVGRALVRAVCEAAAAGRHPCVTLSTFRHVAWNAPFYARLGFRELAEEQLGPGLRRVRADEARRGLDLSRRLVMRLDLAV